MQKFCASVSNCEELVACGFSILHRDGRFSSHESMTHDQDRWSLPNWAKRVSNCLELILKELYTLPVARKIISTIMINCRLSIPSWWMISRSLEYLWIPWPQSNGRFVDDQSWCHVPVFKTYPIPALLRHQFCWDMNYSKFIVYFSAARAASA